MNYRCDNAMAFNTFASLKGDYMFHPKASATAGNTTLPSTIFNPFLSPESVSQAFFQPMSASLTA